MPLTPPSLRSARHAAACAAAGLWLVGSCCAAGAQPAAPVLPVAAPAADAALAADTLAIPGRPKVGLVLGGGGARGAAHVGVLELLERLRVPVDCVAGTSMGALVAGAWAAGLSAQQMRTELAKADWNDMFQDTPDYTELNFRNKRLQQRFLPGSEAGITERGLVTPPGVLSGQKIKLFFNQLVHADVAERDIERLPLPLSIIATDIGNGQRVVLREGSLTTAMRASMSVPGLMAPQELGGRKLVDGGLVDNVPIREVRERCGAEVVIAVNVGSPLLKPEEVSGLLSVTAQMVNLLTEQNVAASLATLKPGRDIYIQPDLGDITAGNFERHAEAAAAGLRAAEQVQAQLAALAVPEPVYARWQQRMRSLRTQPSRIDGIEIAGVQRVNAAVVQRYLQQAAGKPLDTKALNRDLLRAFGDGHYERVDYTLVQQGGRNLLRVTPVEKSWGPDYLRLGLRLESSLGQGSTYQLRVGYQKTWLNTLGGELLLVGDLGSTSGASAEIYQPLEPTQRFFVGAQAAYKRERVDYYFQGTRIAEYRTARSQIDLNTGMNFSLLGQLRLGWRGFRLSNSLETGVDVFSLIEQRQASGWLLALDLDQSDRLYFPRRGWELQASYFDSPGGRYSKLTLDARGAMPVGDFVLGARASWVDSPRGLLPFVDSARLGGFLNLSGYAKGQFLGDGVGYAHVRAERILGRAPLGLRGDLRVGMALEVGRVARPFTVQTNNGFLKSTVIYVGGETPLGPVYLGLGQASGGNTNAYLFIGTP